MIVCWRTVRVPDLAREGFLEWIAQNRRVREENGILAELVLARSAQQGHAKTASPATADSVADDDVVVITAWPSHEVFDAWIDTPARDGITESDVHRSVEYQPITRYDVVGGYLNLDGLSAVTVSPKEEP